MKKFMFVAALSVVACAPTAESYTLDPKQISFVQGAEGQEHDPSMAQGACEAGVGILEISKINFKGAEVSLVGSKASVTSSTDKKIAFKVPTGEASEFIIMSKTPEKLELAWANDGLICTYVFNKSK